MSFYNVGQMKVEVIALTFIVQTATCFFTYEDCSPECRKKYLSCVIGETLKGDFLSNCYEDVYCKGFGRWNFRNFDDVCIPPIGEPRGGEDIWDAYLKWKNRSSTTTTQAPRTTTYRPTTQPSSTTQPTTVGPTTYPTTAGPSTTKASYPNPSPASNSSLWIMISILFVIVAILTIGMVYLTISLRRFGYRTINAEQTNFLLQSAEIEL